MPAKPKTKLNSLTQRLPRYGTTSLLASIVFAAEQEQTRRAIRAVSQRVGKLGHGAVLEGIHFEGPVIADLGAMPDPCCPESKTGSPWNRDMSAAALEALLSEASSKVRVMTISPSVEAKSGYERIRTLLGNSVVPALGHDRSCTEQDMVGALACASPPQRMHLTHLFNVCSFHHRNIGLRCHAYLTPARLNGLAATSACSPSSPRCHPSPGSSRTACSHRPLRWWWTLRMCTRQRCSWR